MDKRIDRRKRDRTNPNAQVPVKIPQPHGGALNSGGTPGNRGGGRPKQTARMTCREMFEMGLPTLNDIVHGDASSSNADKISAMNLFGKFGLGEQKVVVPEHLADALVQGLADEDLTEEQVSRIVEKTLGFLADA